MCNWQNNHLKFTPLRFVDRHGVGEGDFVPFVARVNDLITHQSRRLLQRNLIYTAITRSKSKLIMLGEIAAFEYAVKNQGTMRRTYLVERFEDSGPKTNQIPSSSPKTEQIEESPQESKKDSFILTENR